MANFAAESLARLTRDELINELKTNDPTAPIAGDIILRAKAQDGFSGVMALLDRAVDGPDHESFSPGEVGRALEREFRLLLCSQDEKYRELREELSRAKQSTRQIGVLVATAIAAKWNISAALLTPFVLVFFLGVIELSLKAWCAGDSLESLGSTTA